ncbi:MAG: 2-iminoacetate synthase [Syntrophomonadaceae bacterium]|nr:2-iminoacetate synthase [Bacillota bacterium]
MNYIDEQKISDLLNRIKEPTTTQVRGILKKALSLKGLSPEEASTLISVTDPALLEELMSTARVVKQRIYGNRLVLFAPLYITNYCVNNCLYCGFRRDNKSLKRKRLSRQELIEEVEALLSKGHKRLLLVFGEDPGRGIDDVCETIRTVYGVRLNGDAIRRINVNIASLKKEEFAQLKKEHIGTYQLFQETYHYETYKIMHPEGPKSDYEGRMAALEQAFQAGIDDLGIGVLFGLYDWRFEILAMLFYIQELERRIGIGPHTISLPRVEPALNAPVAADPPYAVNDRDFKKLVAILRLAVPYTGIILTTRESPSLRNELFSLGVSQISAASRTFPGAYRGALGQKEESQQFHLGDTRSLEEVIEYVMKDGILPSFCTACYRTGRTGDEFMSLAKPGLIQRFCLPNAILTLKEYLEDYASDRIKVIGENLIKQGIEEIEGENLRQETSQRLKEIENGKRDIYF